MNIHDVVKVTRLAEAVLAEHTSLSALERMEFCVALQDAIIRSEIDKPVTSPISERLAFVLRNRVPA